MRVWQVSRDTRISSCLVFYPNFINFFLYFYSCEYMFCVCLCKLHGGRLSSSWAWKVKREREGERFIRYLQFSHISISWQDLFLEKHKIHGDRVYYYSSSSFSPTTTQLPVRDKVDHCSCSTFSINSVRTRQSVAFPFVYDPAKRLWLWHVHELF